MQGQMEFTYKLYGGLSSAESAQQGGEVSDGCGNSDDGEHECLMVEDARETKHEEGGDDKEAVAGAQPQKKDRYRAAHHWPVWNSLHSHCYCYCHCCRYCCKRSTVEV